VVETIGLLLFLITVVGVLGAVAYIIYGLVTGKRRQAGLTAVITTLWLIAHVLCMIAVSTLTPQRILDQSQERCFDEMCFSVSHVATADTLGSGSNQQTATGIYYVVTVQLRNASSRTAQKPDHPVFFLENLQGARYTPSPAGHKAVGNEPTWDQKLQTGERQTRDVVFDVSAQTQRPRLGIIEGTGPGPLIIGDEQSLFHKQTQIQLTI
jgi:uncharacterized protein DUF4352